MTTKPTTEKILAEALELHEKGVSLHSIVRTYPEHKEDIEQLFGTMATISLEKEKIKVPKDGLERLLAALPETAPSAARTPLAVPILSPWATFASGIQLSSLKFVLPIAALALLTGGLVLHKDAVTPLAMPTPSTDSSQTAMPAATPTASATKPTGTATTPSAATPTAVPSASPMMKMAALAPTGSSTTDRMVASFSQEAAQEATIAQENDDETATAIAADNSLTTDPTSSYAN